MSTGISYVVYIIGRSLATLVIFYFALITFPFLALLYFTYPSFAMRLIVRWVDFIFRMKNLPDQLYDSYTGKKEQITVKETPLLWVNRD